jgi:3-oxoacyl-[acyl-carrier protein] reductase
MTLKNKTVLITGCNGGIGLALLKRFSENGSDIICCARKKTNEFEDSVNKIKNINKNLIYPVYFDLNNEEEVKDGIEKITNYSKNIEILVNNAGVDQVSLFQMTKEEKIKEVFQVNFFSILILVRAIVKTFIKNKKGSIVNISSNAATECDAGRSIYAASKSALNSFTKCLSKELGPFNIRVNAVAPGLTNTRMIEKNLNKKTLEEIIKRIPLKKIASPEEIANVVLFLASDMSSYVNGEIINITGGY